MSIHDEFVKTIVANPEWLVIRAELCPDEPEPEMIALGGGLSVGFGHAYPPEDQAKAELFSKLCWYVNHGPGYCEDAPPDVKALLRRLGVNV